MALRIDGLATALPAGAMDQAEAAAEAVHYCAETVEQRRLLTRIYTRTTVTQRRSVLIEAPPQARHAQSCHRRSADADAHAVHDAGSRVAHVAGEVNDTVRTSLNVDPASDHAPTASIGSFYPRPEGSHDRGPTVSRRMAAYREHALPLVQRAAEAALHQASVSAGEVSQLITVSCTGFSAPGLDVRLIESLGLDDEVGRTMVGFMGCHGALNGLRVARGLAADPGGVVLLCAVELCTLHFQYGWDADQMLANALFADGAAAMVMRQARASENGIGTDHAKKHDGSPQRQTNGASLAADTAIFNAPSDGGWHVIDTRSKLLPNSHEDMQWHIAEHGFQMVLSRRVPALIEAHLQPWLRRWLGEHELTPAAVSHWAIHPGGPRIITAVERALNLPAGAGDVSRRVLADYGNMSSPTVLFILERLRRQQATGPCLALGFGPGLMVEAALLHAR